MFDADVDLHRPPRMPCERLGTGEKPGPNDPSSYLATMRIRPSFVVFSALAAVAVACANGVAADDDDGGLPIEEEDSGTVTPVRDSALPPQRDAAPPVVDANTGDTGPLLDGGTGDGGTGDGGTNPGACAAPNTCIGGIIMTGVNGDTGADTSTQTGNTSRWLKIRVAENNSSPLDGEKLKLKVTLTSPPGTNFDLRLYLAGDGSSQKCTGPDRTTSSTSGPDVASIDWGEGFLPNLNDDDRTVSIEVVHVSGTCPTTQSWTLLAEGNKL